MSHPRPLRMVHPAPVPPGAGEFEARAAAAVARPGVAAHAG